MGMSLSLFSIFIIGGLVLAVVLVLIAVAIGFSGDRR